MPAVKQRTRARVVKEEAVEELVISELGDLKELAEGVKIDYGGTKKLDREKLRIINKGLRSAWLKLKDHKKTPGFDLVIRTIASAQAAITQMKLGSNKERNLMLLIGHITNAIKYSGALRKVTPAAARAA